MIMYLYKIDVVHGNLLKQICCTDPAWTLAKQTGSLGPSLFLLCTLPGHNSWKPPTLSLCNIQNDLTWISPLCALDRNVYLSPIKCKCSMWQWNKLTSFAWPSLSVFVLFRWDIYEKGLVGHDLHRLSLLQVCSTRPSQAVVLLW